MIRQCPNCLCRFEVKFFFTLLTTPEKQRRGVFHSTQQSPTQQPIPPKPYGWLNGKVWDFMSFTSFFSKEHYQHKEPEPTVQHEFRTYTDNRLDTIKYPNINLSPRQLEQLAKCYVGQLANEWSKAATKKYCRGIGGTKHDKIKAEFLEAKLLICTRGKGRGCTEYELTKEGKEFLRRFL